MAEILPDLYSLVSFQTFILKNIENNSFFKTGTGNIM